MKNLKSALNYGSIAGICSFMMFLFFFYLGFNPLGNISWLSVWIPVVFIIIGIKHYRHNELDGYIKYGRALTVGLIISFVFASFSAMLVYLFGTFVDSGFLEMYLDNKGEALELGRQFFSENFLERLAEEMERMTIGKLAFSDFQNKMIGGLIISFIVVAFLKKSPEELY